jgi:hypothetical protein
VLLKKYNHRPVGENKNKNMSYKINKLSLWENMKKFSHLFLILTIVFWMTGLFLTNYSNAQNLQRSELTNSIRQTEDKLRLLNAEIGTLQSIERVEQESQRLNLVKVDNANIIYLSTAIDKVALK